LVRFVSDLAAINYTDMNLAYCPGADYKSDAAIAFQPVLQSLAHNTYFRAVTARDIVFDEKAGDVAALGVAMRTNRTILKLIISNASITDITELGASLTLNKFHQLMVLDLSKNNLSNEKGVLALADALAVYPHALKVLNLERCSISPRGMQALFEAFGKNYGMSLSIQELYVGGNNFLDIGSAAFNKWLDTAKAYAGLRRVSLANCNALNTAVVVKHLIPVAPRLEWLDVSGCKINDDDMSTFQSLIFALKSHYRVPEAQVPTEEDEQIGVADPLVLKFSNCQLSINGLISLFSSLRQNTALRQVALDISQNDIGPNGMATLAKEIKAARCITSLNLADTKLKGMKGIQTLIDQGIPPFLTTLVLDENFSASEGGELTALLGRWLASNPQLLNLSLRGGRSSHLRRAVLPLLDFLKSNITLEYLDISYNYIGDQAAFAIAECLRENKKLKYLHLDRNQITISGWMTIYTALVTRNRTLVSVGSPVVDMEKALAQIPEVKRPELHSLFFQLRTLLARNLSSSLPPPSSSSSPDVVDGSMFEILSPRSVVASRFVQLHPLALFAPATDSEFVSPLRDGPSFFEHHVPLPSFLGGSASAPPPFTRDSRLSLALTASPIPSSSTVLLSPAPSTAHLNPEQTNSSTQATPKKEKHSRKTKAPKATPTPDVDQSDIPPVPAEPTASNDTILPSTPPPAPSAAPSEPSVGSVGTNSVPDESPPPPPPSYIPPPPNSGNSDSNGPSRPVSRVIRASEMPPPPPPPPNAPPPPPPR
jgi:Ran GTPase-activating protein (RanGAP) involved in mRNA processing and transport